MKKFIAILSVFLSFTAYAGDGYKELKEQADNLVEQYSSTDGIMSQDGKIENAAQLKARFLSGHDFLFKVVGTNITDEQKAELVVEVTEAYGKMFAQITKPYEDVAGFEYEPGRNDTFFQKLWGNTWAGLKRFGLGFGRDIKTAVTLRTVPFLGQDSKRSALINKVGKSLEKRFDQAVKEIGTEQGKQDMAVILELLQKVHASEVIRYGHSNVVQITTYLGIGIWQFFQPLTELPFERTTFSPIVAGAMDLMIMGYMINTRLVNSGVKFNNIVKGLEKRAKALGEQVNLACIKGLGGKGNAKATAQE